jgi:hypothetical protein
MTTLIRSVATILLRAIRFVMVALRAIFGEIRWSPAPWMTAAWDAAWSVAAGTSGALQVARRRNPTRFWIIGAGLLLAVVAGGSSRRWYRNRPQPRYVEINGSSPHATELKPEAQIDPLRLFFTASAARLGTVGKTVTSGTVREALDNNSR